MVTIQIDESTFDHWSQQAQSTGLTVEEWLKAVTGVRNVAPKLTQEQRRKNFDDLLEFVKSQNVNTHGTLDDSRESIYGERG